jgi:hypothetical protein
LHGIDVVFAGAPSSKASASVIGDNSASAAHHSVGQFVLDLSPCKRMVGRIHREAGRDDKPRMYDGKIDLFVAPQLADGFTAAGNQDATFGWGRRTTQRVEVHLTSGVREGLRSTLFTDGYLL